MIYYDIVIRALRNEIVQIVACHNFDGFQHITFILSQKIISLFLKYYLMKKLTL
jgi:hypothetical protein